MKYKLLNNSGKGVLIGRTPLMLDLHETFTIDFKLPEGSENLGYIALLTGKDKLQHIFVIKDGKLALSVKDKLKRASIFKEQYIDLIVQQTDGDKIIQSWHCEAIKVTTHSYLNRSQFEISGGMTDKDCYNRLVEVEHLLAKYRAEIDSLTAEYTSAINVKNEELKLVIEQNDELINQRDSFAETLRILEQEVKNIKDEIKA